MCKLLFRTSWPRRANRIQNIISCRHAWGYPLEFADRPLLLEKPYAQSQHFRLVWTQKLYLYWIPFTVLDGAMQATGTLNKLFYNWVNETHTRQRYLSKNLWSDGPKS